MDRRSSLPSIDLLKGVIPISRASATLSEIIKRARENSQAIVVTQNGYPSAVIMDIDTYAFLRTLAEKYFDEHTEE
jgi:prevent-host-death family protein